MQNEQIAEVLAEEAKVFFRNVSGLTVQSPVMLELGVALPIIDRVQPHGCAFVVVTQNDLSGKSTEQKRAVLLERLQFAYNRLLRLRGRTTLMTITLEKAGEELREMVRRVFSDDQDAVYDDAKFVAGNVYVTVMDNKTGAALAVSISSNLIQGMTPLEFAARAEREARLAKDKLAEMRANQ